MNIFKGENRQAKNKSVPVSALNSVSVYLDSKGIATIGIGWNLQKGEIVMKLRFFLAFFIFKISIAANASCEMWKDGSTDQQACVIAEDKDMLKVEIKNLQEKIVEKYTNKHMFVWVDIFKEGQAQWENYLKKQCELEQHVFGGIGSISQIRCERRLSEARLDELKKM